MASSTRTCPSCGASVVPDGACPACGFTVRALVQADDLRGPGRAGVAFTVGWEVGFDQREGSDQRKDRKELPSSTAK